MTKAVRAKNESPDMIYFDDWFAQVPVDELVGKSVYIDPGCISFNWDRAVLKKIKAMGVITVTKKAFATGQADYIVVPTGWTKTQKVVLPKRKSRQ